MILIHTQCFSGFFAATSDCPFPRDQCRLLVVSEKHFYPSRLLGVRSRDLGGDCLDRFDIADEQICRVHDVSALDNSSRVDWPVRFAFAVVAGHAVQDGRNRRHRGETSMPYARSA
ncbi:hypothetical protein AQ942_02045 [Burkholderia pseudomallei]|nr:hypothetical protein AQ942_02045 [Burkholderia pseudomallei]